MKAPVNVFFTQKTGDLNLAPSAALHKKLSPICPILMQKSSFKPKLPLAGESRPIVCTTRFHLSLC